MNDKDTDFLLESWKTLCDQQKETIKALRELVDAQQKVILRLQGVQVTDPQIFSYRGE